MSLAIKDEFQEFLNAASKAGYKKSDFDLTLYETTPKVDGIFPTMCTIGVRRNSNGCTHKYSVSSWGSAWGLQLEEDLRVGKFGPP